MNQDKKSDDSKDKLSALGSNSSEKKTDAVLEATKLINNSPDETSNINNSDEEDKIEYNLKMILSDICNTLTLPLYPFHIAFFLYLGVVIVLVGGIGIWISIFEAYSSPLDDGINVAHNLGTFFIAIWATTFIDLNVGQRIGKLTSSIIQLLLWGLMIGLFFLTYYFPNDFAFIPAITGYVIVIFSWYFANADNDKFDEATYSDKVKKRSRQRHRSPKPQMN